MKLRDVRLQNLQLKFHLDTVCFWPLTLGCWSSRQHQQASSTQSERTLGTAADPRPAIHATSTIFQTSFKTQNTVINHRNLTRRRDDLSFTHHLFYQPKAFTLIFHSRFWINCIVPDFPVICLNPYSTPYTYIVWIQNVCKSLKIILCVT